MAITFVSQGTTPLTSGVGTGTISCSPDMPASLAAGNILIMLVGSKPDTMNVDDVTDWTRIGDFTGGAGSHAADTGPVRITAFYRVVVTGSETAPTVVQSADASFESIWAQIFQYNSSFVGGSWSIANSGGADSTAGAAWSVTCAADPGFQTGDWAVVGSNIPTDVSVPGQFSAEAITATGVTFNTATERSEPDTTAGFDQGGFIFDADVASGTSSAAPVVTATAGGTTTNVAGASIVVRLREVAASTKFTVFQSINRASNW